MGVWEWADLQCGKSCQMVGGSRSLTGHFSNFVGGLRGLLYSGGVGPVLDFEGGGWVSRRPTFARCSFHFRRLWSPRHFAKDGKPCRISTKTKLLNPFYRIVRSLVLFPALFLFYDSFFDCQTLVSSLPHFPHFYLPEAPSLLGLIWKSQKRINSIDRRLQPNKQCRYVRSYVLLLL